MEPTCDNSLLLDGGARDEPRDGVHRAGPGQESGSPALWSRRSRRWTARRAAAAAVLLLAATCISLLLVLLLVPGRKGGHSPHCHNNTSVSTWRWITHCHWFCSERKFFWDELQWTVAKLRDTMEPMVPVHLQTRQSAADVTSLLLGFNLLTQGSDRENLFAPSVSNQVSSLVWLSALTTPNKRHWFESRPDRRLLVFAQLARVFSYIPNRSSGDSTLFVGVNDKVKCMCTCVLCEWAVWRQSLVTHPKILIWPRQSYPKHANLSTLRVVHICG